MPVRDRQQARALKMCLSAVAASALSLAIAAPSATAAPPTTNPKPSSNKPSSPGSSAKPTPPPDCSATAAPPTAKELDGDQPPLLEVPSEPAGGERMAQCGVVLPPNAKLPPDGLTAASWIIVDQNSGDVLAANAPHARQRPAGTIKVLLALVALRELDPNAVIVAAKEDTAQKGGTRVGLVADGKYTAKDLIRALIVTAGNDVSSALTRELGGVDATQQKMNNLAHSLGALDTRVTNPTGLDMPGMSTSAYDTALVYREAMRNEEFAATTGAKTVVITPQGGRTRKISRPTDNKLLDTVQGATGGKAGFTDAAKSTFVGSAERDGRHLVVGLLRAEKTSTAPFDQAESLLGYGFELAASKMQPVGRISGAASEPTNTSGDTPPAAEKKSDTAAPPTIQRSAFGTFGLPVTIAAGAVVLLGLLLTARRKLASARRLRAQAR